MLCFTLTATIGRIIDLCNNQVKIKFFKSELNSFIWPRDEDVAFVEKKYIFYSPIELIGTGPFVLKHSDLAAIHKKYKLIKCYEFQIFYLLILLGFYSEKLEL